MMEISYNLLQTNNQIRYSLINLPSEILIIGLTVGTFFVFVKSIIVSDCLTLFEIVGFFFNISGFKNRLSLFSVFVDVDGLSSINLVRSASVEAAVDSISTGGISGNSGSCGVNEGFLIEREKNEFIDRFILLCTNFIH